MAKALCDFCSQPQVVWRYPAQNFLAYVIAGIAGQSVGDWAACSVCHALIQAGNRSELANRSVRTLIEKHPEMRGAEAEIREQIAQFHVMFFDNRTGGAMPVA